MEGEDPTLRVSVPRYNNACTLLIIPRLDSYRVCKKFFVSCSFFWFNPVGVVHMQPRVLTDTIYLIISVKRIMFAKKLMTTNLMLYVDILNKNKLHVLTFIFYSILLKYSKIFALHLHINIYLTKKL